MQFKDDGEKSVPFNLPLTRCDTPMYTPSMCCVGIASETDPPCQSSLKSAPRAVTMVTQTQPIGSSCSEPMGCVCGITAMAAILRSLVGQFCLTCYTCTAHHWYTLFSGATQKCTHMYQTPTLSTLSNIPPPKLHYRE